MNDKRFNENEEQEKENGVTSRPQTVEPGALITAVPDKSFSRAIGNQAMQRLAAPGKMVQRQATNETDTAVAPAAPTRAPLIVPDETADLQPGQMRRAEFLAQLRTAVCQTADQSLAGTIYSAIGCPYIERWFAYYNGQDSQHIERALQRFVPETAQATSAQSCIPLVCQRVGQGIAGWLTTGEVAGVPEGAAADLPPVDASGMPGGTAVGGLLPAAGQILSRVGALLFKRQDNSPEIAADPAATQAQLGAGQPLDSGLRRRMAAAFGSDFNQVRVHTDADAGQLAGDLNARAFTVGGHIAFAPGEYQPNDPIGGALIAHELAHVQQQENAAPAALQANGGAGYGALEEDADLAAATAVVSLFGGGPQHRAGIAQTAVPRLKSGLRLQGCKTKSGPTTTPLQDAYAGRTPWTAPLAQQALNEYNGLSSADQATWVNTHYASGTVQKILQAMPAADIAAGGAHNATIQSILQRVQRTGATTMAAGLGLASQTAMAQEQAKFMHAQNVAAAQASVPVGVVPTPAQVSAQQATQVAQTSIAPQTAVLSAADEAQQNTDGATAVAAFITWVTANHPGLGIKAADFRVDARAIFDRGQSIIAFAEAPKLVVGRSFTLAVNANPAYALPTVVHELRGHEQYGPYGAPGAEFGLELYDQAAALMPGYTQPSGAARTAEIDAYAYQETEIYSLMLEVPYFTPVAAKDAALSSINYDPSPEISNRIGLIKNQWEPRIARSMVRGLVLRFRLDPRVTPKARNAFEQGVRHHFTAAEATDILK